MKFLNNFDLFGYTYQQPYFPNQTTFKSNFGAIFTISLYSLSLLYFVYKMNSWLGGEINPKSSSTYEVEDEIDLLLGYPLMTVSFDFKTSQLNPLNESEKIISISMITTQNLTTQQYELSPYDNSTLVLNNFNITYNKELNSSSLYPNDIILILAICNSTLDKNCASKQKINQFLEIEGMTMTVKLNFLYFNSKSNSFKQIAKSLQFAIDSDMTLLNTIQLQVQRNIINDGVLFDNMNELQVVNDAQIVTQSVKQEYFKYFSGGIISVFEFSLNPLIQIQSIQYTKISEILADVGSIVSTLMFLKIVALTMNQYLLQEFLNFQIISCYYPQFKELTIERNVFGQIKSVFFYNNKIGIQDFNQFYQKAKQISQKKQTIINIVYEISRMQFLMQQLLERNKFTQTHKLGIPLQFEFNHQSNTIVPLDETIQVSDREKNIFGNDDFNILTLENI